MKFLLLFSLFFPSLACQGQDSSRNESHIYFKPFIGWKKNGNRLTQNELKLELYKVPEAIPYYQKSKTNKILSYSSFVPGMTFIVLSRNRDINSPNYGQTQIGFLIAGTLFNVACSYFILNSLNFLKKAAKIHNEKIQTAY